MSAVFAITDFFPSTIGIPGKMSVRQRHSSSPVPCCLTLVNLSELADKSSGNTLENIAAACCSAEERALFARYTYPKRKREWLGGRLAAKLAFLTLAGLTPTEDRLHTISILPRENGSPMLYQQNDLTDPSPSLSISHSGNYAVGMAANGVTCGVDIQQISEKTERVADKFCTRDEIQLLCTHLPRFSKLERLSLLWAAKEALKKSLLKDQPTIFQGVILQAVKLGDEVTLQLSVPGESATPAKVSALGFDEYMLAFTVSDADHA